MILKINNKLLVKLMAMIMIAFAGLTFTACGGDDDEPEQEESSNGSSSSSSTSSLRSKLIGAWSNGTDSTITFKSNGTGTSTYRNETVSFKEWQIVDHSSCYEITALHTSGSDKGKVRQVCTIARFVGDAFADCNGDVYYKQ
ncbi:MAG: hypothetical protein LIP03_09120 [Bacteroidales bacterium]|nr:hypothetical protein [Bacteroidales bacterium]